MFGIFLPLAVFFRFPAFISLISRVAFSAGNFVLMILIQTGQADRAVKWLWNKIVSSSRRRRERKNEKQRRR
jgi:hypothetical protein